MDTRSLIDTKPSFFHDIPGMDDSCLTRPYLESLSTDELVKLADSFGIDIPSGLERVFIIEELLDIAIGDDTGFESGEDPVRPDFIEAAALPKQYNISYIEVLIRDPLWAFVFWEIKGHDKEAHAKAPDFGGYCLRVIPRDGAGEHPFTVPVGVEDTAWYLGFPPAEGSYQVELCVLRGEEVMALTISRPFTLPRLLEPPNRKTSQQSGFQEVYRNPLACLAGAFEFPVIRSADRRSRTKGNGEMLKTKA